MTRVIGDDGEILATIDGQVLGADLPPGLELRRVRDDYRLLRPPGGFYCGSAGVAYVRNGRLEVATVELLPPYPWHWPAIRKLWDSSTRLRGYRSGSGGAVRWMTGRVEPAPSQLALESLRSCIDEGRRLLSRWPQRFATSSRTAPVDLPFGAEDLRKTEYELGAGRREFTRRNGVVRPLVSDRTTSSTEAWRSLRVSNAAAVLTDALERAAERWGLARQSIEPLLSPLAQVHAHSRTSAVDLSPSSWPVGFQRFHGQAVRTLSRVAPMLRGSDAVPLVRIWELYEEWLAERVLSILVRILGWPTEGADGARLARWEVGANRVELLFKPAFTPGTPLTIGSGAFIAVVGDRLVPDLVLASTVGDHTRLLVIDAKDRTRITPGELAGEASKYLWGLRRSHNPARGDSPSDVPAIEGVVLVAPLGGATSERLPLGKAMSIHAAPFASPGRAIGALGQDLSQRRVRDWLVLLDVTAP